MNVSQSLKSSLTKSLSEIKMRKELVYFLVFILAMVAFEAFNYSTTDFALSDLLGDLRFAGFRWATLLSIAFCGIDFAGVAWLFMPPATRDEQHSMWFLFGAWVLAATMNAILTWWGVLLAIQSHPVVSSGIVGARFVTRTTPIMVALMVWVIRILLVGALTKKPDPGKPIKKQTGSSTFSKREYRQAQSRAAHAVQSGVPGVSFNVSKATNPGFGKRTNKPEPTYVPMQDEVMYHTLKTSTSARRQA